VEAAVLRLSSQRLALSHRAPGTPAFSKVSRLSACRPHAKRGVIPLRGCDGSPYTRCWRCAAPESRRLEPISPREQLETNTERALRETLAGAVLILLRFLCRSPKH